MLCVYVIVKTNSLVLWFYQKGREYTMKNQKSRNVIKGLLVLLICFALIGCDETSATGSLSSELLKETVLYDAVSSSSESASSELQSMIS